ncbi:MAG: DsbE family thiol:disulfide interchange protein [Geminicoccaceae bacterium]|nr:DsbE family thiol:disulfide interchange protein [Geminicoccaceae bacterium]
MSRRWLYIIPVVAFVAIAGFLAIGLTQDPGVLPSALLDKPAPEFDLPGLEGMGLATSDLAEGQVTLVNVFASWCVPCRVEHPFITKLAEEGVRVVGINYKDKPEDARAWLNRHGNPYDRIGTDRDGRAAIDWGVYGVPESFIVDGKGIIRYKQVGPIQERDLRDTIRPILGHLEQ